MFEGISDILMQGASRLSGMQQEMTMEKDRLRNMALENFKQAMLQKYMQQKQLEEQRKARRQNATMQGAQMAASLGGGLGGAAIQANAMKGLMGALGGGDFFYPGTFVGAPR